jgi:transcriptional regulator with XRE-family HTH domain
MNDNISNRLVQILHHFGITKAELSRRLELNNNVTITRIALGKVKPSYEMILKILKTFSEINGDWLMTGRGEMILKEDGNNDELFEQQKWMIDYLKKELDEKRNEYLLLKHENVYLKNQLNGKK